MEGDFKMAKKNYIVRGVGYVSLLSAIIEQANDDIEKARKRGNMVEVADCEKGIEEWADIAAADINFKIYE